MMIQSRRLLCWGGAIILSAIGAFMFVKPATNHNGVIQQETIQGVAPDAPLERNAATAESGRHKEEPRNPEPDDEQAPSKAAIEVSVSQPTSPQSSTEADADRWKILIGQPAPELAPQGWLFGEATSLAKLRGRWIALYFWENVISDGDLSAWIVLHERFGEQGPVVIIVKPQIGESIEEELAHFEGVCHTSLEGRTLPFRVLIDQREPNIIAGTTIQTAGATHSAYRVAYDRPGKLIAPLALLIGPDGTVRQQIANRPDRRVIRELETVTGLKAGTPQWETTLLREYSLAGGAVLRRIAPPYSQARDDYCFFNQGRTKATMTFVQGEKLQESWMSHGTVGSLQFVLRSVVGFRSYELIDPDDVANRELFIGDWCVRAGTPREELLRELERILKTDLDWNVRFERTTIKQDVVVVTGNWKQAALPGAKNESWIYLTADDVPDPNFGGGGSGSLDAMLAWLADSVRMKFVSEVAAQPTGSLVWTDQLDKHQDGIRQATPAGEEALIKVLENLAHQTGLSFESEERDVDVWRIVAE